MFPPDTLEDAPQSIFTAAHVPVAHISDIQNRVVAKYPNVGVVDVNQAVTALAVVVRNLSLVIRVLAGVSIAAGVLIIVSAVFATRLARTQEAVYFKVLGANNAFVIRVFSLENVILGASSAFIAVGIAQGASWALSVWVFDIEHHPHVLASTLLLAVTVLLVVVVGLGASLSILRKRPIVFLREHD